jgi:4-amino-4-deoxy-L-arabinose transferase-like glycosyltransferase
MNRLKAFSIPALLLNERCQLVFILLLAFFLRVNGLSFGFRYLLHPDEIQYVRAGTAFLIGQEKAIDQLETLNNPPLFKSALGLLYITYTYALIPDHAQIPEAPTTRLWSVFYYYVGRLASASSGLLTVALLYVIGKRLYDRKIGVLAAFLLSVSFLHVRESHFAVNDAPLTFLTTLGLLGGATILHRGRWRDYAATGLVIGLAVATKYTGAQMAGVLLLAHWLRQRQVKARRLGYFLSPRLWLGLVMVPVGLVMGAPIVVTSWQATIKGVTQLAEFGQAGYKDLLLDPQGGWIFYLKTLTWGAGWLMAAAFLVVLVLALIKRFPEDLILLVYPVLLYAFMGYQQMFFARFILPVLPPLILLVAAWLGRLSQLSRRLHPAVNSRAVLLAATGLIALQPLAMSVWFGIVLNRPDTRATAIEWIKANLPEGSTMYADQYAIPRKTFNGFVSLPNVQLKTTPVSNLSPLKYYPDQGIQFLVTSDYFTDVPYAEAAKESVRQKALKAVSQLKLIREFQPYWLPGPWFSYDQRYGPAAETLLRQYPGPVIRVYDLRATR